MVTFASKSKTSQLIANKGLELGKLMVLKDGENPHRHIITGDFLKIIYKKGIKLCPTYLFKNWGP